MKNIFFFLFSMLFLFSCKEGETQQSSEAAAVSPDSIAIAGVIHSFYQWYDPFVHDTTKNINFTKVVNQHYALDLPLLEKYLADIKSSGFVNAEFLDGDMAFYKACEKIWQKEEADGPPAGMDADKYFCAQDWDINVWIKAPVQIKSVDNDKATATMQIAGGESPTEQSFELKKEGGKWLISKIACDMGLDEY